MRRQLLDWKPDVIVLQYFLNDVDQRNEKGASDDVLLHLTDPHTPHDPRPEPLAQLGGERPADFPQDGLDAFNSERLQALGSRRETH